MAHMFAHLGQLDAEFMPAIAVAAAPRRKSFSPNLLVSVFHIEDAPVVILYLLSKSSPSSEEGVVQACTLRAFAMLQERNYMLLGAFADEACRQMRSFSPNSLVRKTQSHSLLRTDGAVLSQGCQVQLLLFCCLG